MATSKLKETLRPYQIEYLRDTSRRKCWVAARRIGKSYIVSLEAFLSALPGDMKDNLVVSHDQEASNDLLEYIRGWSRYFTKMGVPEAQIIRDRATEVRIGSGCRIIAIPGGRPAAIRHYGGSVWLDEAAIHRDLKKNLSAAGPAISEAGGKLRVISTILSDIDEFSQIVDGKREGWNVHNTTIHEAIRQGHRKRDGSPIEIDELRLDVPDPSVFACEFENVPLSESDSFFGKELLDVCAAKWAPAFTDGSSYGGFDIARSKRGHRSVIGEQRTHEHRHQARIIETMRGMEFEDQEGLALRAFADNGWVRMAIDASGIGAGSAERIRKKLTGARVEEVKFSPQVQVDLMTDLKAVMLKDDYAIDPADRDLWLDLYSIKRKIGVGGRIGFEADVTERGHADRAWTVALANRAAGTARPPSKRKSTTIKQRRRPRERMY